MPLTPTIFTLACNALLSAVNDVLNAADYYHYLKHLFILAAKFYTVKCQMFIKLTLLLLSFCFKHDCVLFLLEKFWYHVVAVNFAIYGWCFCTSWLGTSAETFTVDICSRSWGCWSNGYSWKYAGIVLCSFCCLISVILWVYDDINNVYTNT